MAQDTYDLRVAFAHAYGQRWFAPARPEKKDQRLRRPQRAFENDAVEVVDAAGNEEGESGGSDDQNEDDGSGADDPASSPPSGAGDDNEGEQVEDPAKKRLSDEAAKYRRERNELRAQVEDLTRKVAGKQTNDDYEKTIRSLRLELAWERAATGAHISDIEAAWRLAADDLAGVKVEDGKVDTERLQQIVDHVAQRYPYLTDDYAPDDANVVTATSPSGRPVNGKKDSQLGTDRRALEKKFPALRRR